MILDAFDHSDTVHNMNDTGTVRYGGGFIYDYNMKKVRVHLLSVECMNSVFKKTKHCQNTVANIPVKPLLRIHDILGWIRIRIRGSMPLTNGFGSWIRILLFSSLTFKMLAKN